MVRVAGSPETGGFVVDSRVVDGSVTAGLVAAGLVAAGVEGAGVEGAGLEGAGLAVGVGPAVFLVVVAGVVVTRGASVLRTCTFSVFGSGGGVSAPAAGRPGIEPDPLELPAPALPAPALPGIELLAPEIPEAELAGGVTLLPVPAPIAGLPPAPLLPVSI